MISSIKKVKNILKFTLNGIDKKPVPVKLTWEVGMLCNSKCKYCQRWSVKDTSTDLTTEEGEVLLRQINEAGVSVISFSGGEPLLRDDIYHLISYAAGLGLTTSLISNGLLIDSEERATRLCSTGLDRICLSLDGPVPEVHDSIRGIKGGFEKVISAAHLLKKNRSGGKPKIYFNTTLSKENIAEFKEITELVHQMKVDGWAFQLVHEGSNETLLFPEENILVECDAVRKLHHDMKSMKSKYRALFVHYDGFYDNFVTYVDDKEKLYKYRCIAGTLAGTIDPNGNVRVCISTSYVLGNIREKSFIEIWHSEKANEARQDIKNGECPLCWMCCYAPLTVFLSDVEKFRLHKILSKPNIKNYLRMLKVVR